MHISLPELLSRFRTFNAYQYTLGTVKKVIRQGDSWKLSTLFIRS